jgi:hypothetical protein
MKASNTGDGIDYGLRSHFARERIVDIAPGKLDWLGAVLRRVPAAGSPAVGAALDGSCLTIQSSCRLG